MPLGRISWVSWLSFLSFSTLSGTLLAQAPPPAEPAPPVAPEPAAAEPVAAPGDPAAPAAQPEAPPPPEPPPPDEQGEPSPPDVSAEEPAPAPPAPKNQLRLELENGTSIRFGVLWQAQYEALGNSANDDLSHNLFIRRFAILIGGTVLKDFEYFIDTDFIDLFKAPVGEEGLKSGPSIQTKDAFGTFRVLDDRLKIDGGLLIPPGSHNSLQGGGSILPVDFFANAFVHNLAFRSTHNPYGRDVGFQLRGLVGPVEYRAGVFQGRRSAPQPTAAGSRNSFRYAARVQVNFLDPENAYFYGGTYLGTKSVFSVGAAADFQHHSDDSYRAFAGDAFLDLPVGDDGVSAQVNLVHRNGGQRVVLPKQTALSAEAGWRFGAAKLSPIVRVERRWADAAPGDATWLGGGLSYWAFGHTSNLKAFFTRIIPQDPVDPFNQFNLQWQLFFY